LRSGVKPRVQAPIEIFSAGGARRPRCLISSHPADDGKALTLLNSLVFKPSFLYTATGMMTEQILTLEILEFLK
jgi:hypothetical protein